MKMVYSISMILTGKILNRVRETLDRLIAAPRRGGSQLDFLVKMNLSPLMGRRDAAILRLEALWLTEEIFSLDLPTRTRLYSNSAALLAMAQADTAAILATLSSADMVAREEQLLAFLSLLRQLVGTLLQAKDTWKSLSAQENSKAAEFILGRSDGNPRAALALNENIFSDGEVVLVGRICEFLGRTRDRIKRYREYTEKNFSPSNAERYRKALREYSTLYK